LGKAGLAGGISQGSGKILRIHSGSALYLRRIRCMAGPLVPHGLAGDRQCVFLSGACSSIRETWRRFDIGSLGTALGLGKDKGGDFFRRMGMPSLCTVCRAPTAASFSIDCIRWIQRLPCPPAQKSNALLRKCIFAPEMRFMNSRKTSRHSSPPHLLSF